MPKIVASIARARATLYEVQFQDGTALLFCDESIVEYGLKRGREIPEREFEQMVHKDQVKRAKSRLLYLLSCTAKSEQQIRRRLQDEGFFEASIEEALDFARTYQFVDDAKLSRNFAAQKAASARWSKRKIQAALEQKGVDKAQIQQALEDLPQDQEWESALYIARKKVRSLSLQDPLKTLQKLQQSLLYQGFSYETVKKAASTAWQERKATESEEL